MIHRHCRPLRAGLAGLLAVLPLWAQAADFDGAQLRELILVALADPADLTRAATAAKSAGIPDAADRLARQIATLIQFEDRRS